MATKADPVFTPEEIFRFIDLGLGRGIDATNPRPWLNKTSFQVRRVHKDNIIGTEEGGSLQSYEREVASVHSQQTTMKLSITIPQSPLTLGTDAEMSRSISTSRRAIGKRVVNRTISFRDDFIDVPVSSAKDFCSAREEAMSSVHLVQSLSAEHQMQQPGYEPGMTHTKQSMLTFEERLAHWLVQRITAHREKAKILNKIDEDLLTNGAFETAATAALEHSNPLEALARIIEHGDKPELKLIINACAEFVDHFRTTHYVSSIVLGAAEYRVLTEQEYYSKVGIAGSFGLEKLANGAFGGSALWKGTRKASDTRKIGHISNEGVVDRGSYREAVVGVRILPISSLVRLQFLQLALEKALVRFVDTEGDNSGEFIYTTLNMTVQSFFDLSLLNYTDGPFLIACNNDMFYLMVDPPTKAVLVTTDIQQASSFFIAPTDDGHNQYEFLIVHYGDTNLRKELFRRRASALSNMNVFEVQPIAYYLTAPLNLLGRNSGPLYMNASADQRECRFVLHHRLNNQRSSATAFDHSAWTSSRDVFFVNCSQRMFKRDGYLVVKWDQRSNSFITACVPFIKRSNNREETHMLFRLFPISFRNQESNFKREPSVKEKDHTTLSKLDKNNGDHEPRRRGRDVRFLGVVDVHSTP